MVYYYSPVSRTSSIFITQWFRTLSTACCTKHPFDDSFFSACHVTHTHPNPWVLAALACRYTDIKTGQELQLHLSHNRYTLLRVRWIPKVQTYIAARRPYELLWKCTQKLVFLQISLIVITLFYGHSPENPPKARTESKWERFRGWYCTSVQYARERMRLRKARA